MKRNRVYLLFLLLLLSSCSLMQRFGIEKRRYRPGFYIGSVAASRSLTQIKKAGIPLSVHQKEIVLALRSKIESLPGKDKVLIKHHQPCCAFPPSAYNRTGYPLFSGVKVMVQPKRIIPADNSSIYAPKYPAGNGNDVWLYLVLTLIYVLITIAIKALFPAVSWGLASFLALLAMLVLIELMSLIIYHHF